MAISRDDVRKDILERPCEKCGESVSEETNCLLTFFRGSFVILHKECADFIPTAQKGPRR